MAADAEYVQFLFIDADVQVNTVFMLNVPRPSGLIATPDVNVQVPEPLNVPYHDCPEVNVILFEDATVQVFPVAIDNVY